MIVSVNRFASSLSAFVSAAVIATPAYCDVISDWNLRAETLAAEKRVAAVPSAHNMALFHVAIFEAVNAVENRYSPYKLDLRAHNNVSREAATGAAAHTILVHLFPNERGQLDTALQSSLSSVPDGEPKTAGLELGKRAALGLIAQRANDGANAPESYRPHTAPGIYVPTAIPASSTFGNTKPWALEKGSQFRPAPPPPLTSQEWTNDLNEIREFGGLIGSKRTAEQTNIGRFWLITGPQSWNPVVRRLVNQSKLDLVDQARVFALVALACADAYIAVFDAKYFYNFWRPLTAIRNADITGNSATPRDASWLPLGETPMHPEYPCAHCITSAAAAVVLKSTFGNDIGELAMTSPTAPPGVTRIWRRIDDYPSEVALARIYAGFHYRFSTRVGAEMGRKIGEVTIKTQLLPREPTAIVPK